MFSIKPWVRLYRPARDWRSGADDAIELRFGVTIRRRNERLTHAETADVSSNAPEGAEFLPPAYGFQGGLIWGVRCGLGGILWRNRTLEPIWYRNWFTTVQASAV